MKKNGKNPKKVKKEEARKEAAGRQKPVVLKGLKEIGKVPLERQEPATAPKKAIPKSPEPKAPKPTLWKWKIPGEIESFIRENTAKGKMPRDIIPTVMKMFDGIKKLEEKAAKKRAVRAVWQVRHELGVTRKPKSEKK